MGESCLTGEGSDVINNDDIKTQMLQMPISDRSFGGRSDGDGVNSGLLTINSVLKEGDISLLVLTHKQLGKNELVMQLTEGPPYKVRFAMKIEVDGDGNLHASKVV